MKLVSPESMMTAAKQQMLDGREPQSQQDWQLVVNFFAFNADPLYAKMVVPIMCRLYDIPLDEVQVNEIVQYQLDKRANLN
jgi:hypothetical protein